MLYSGKFDDSKGITTSCKSEKDRQYNGQMKKDKRSNNDLQKIAQKTKDRVTRTPLMIGGELIGSGWKGKDFLLYMWQPSCYSCYKPGEIIYVHV